MNTFFHLLKYSLVFNKIRILFLGVLSILIYGLTSYFFETQKAAAEAMMQYSFYVMFMIFTGKMNARNNLMFDIKHLIALPLNKYQIVFIKSMADTVQLLPIAAVFLYGFYKSFPQFHLPIVLMLFVILLTFANIIAFNKRVDFSRMQHSQASFKNSFLFFHKYLEMFIQIIMGVFSVGIVLVIFEKNILMREYGFLILLILATFIATHSSLKMLMDETRSYFVFKRDIFRIGWKVIVVAIPLFIFDGIYKGKGIFKELVKKEDPFVSRIKDGINEIESVTNKRFLLAVAQNDEKILEQYWENPKNIPWNAEIMGAYAPHLSVSMGRLDLLKKLVELNPEAINMEGKYQKRTPIFSAVRRCKMKELDYLLAQNVNVNHVDNSGMTPILFAAKNKCYGAVLMLSQKGADLAFKDKKDRTIFDYLGKRSGLSYMLKRYQEPEIDPTRELASEKKK